MLEPQVVAPRRRPPQAALGGLATVGGGGRVRRVGAPPPAHLLRKRPTSLVPRGGGVRCHAAREAPAGAPERAPTPASPPALASRDDRWRLQLGSRCSTTATPPTSARRRPAAAGALAAAPAAPASPAAPAAPAARAAPAAPAPAAPAPFSEKDAKPYTVQAPTTQAPPRVALTARLAARLLADLLEAFKGATSLEDAQMAVSRRWGFESLAEMTACIEAEANASYLCEASPASDSDQVSCRTEIC
mmetsp:Transcript_43135/g.91957  ORF Transcript_43135/g.91957 Transcript_43135/m.91957 type:complete len:246 (-) Transcript_43135:60-797(-)